MAGDGFGNAAEQRFQSSRAAGLRLSRAGGGPEASDLWRAGFVIAWVRACVAAALISSGLAAQSLSVGVRAGAPLTPWLDAAAGARGGRAQWVLGPAVEVRLWRGAALEADFLVGRAALSPAGEASRASVWRGEAPVTVRYTAGAWRGRPFVRGGVSFNRVLGIAGAEECGRGPFGERFYCAGPEPLAELRHRGTWGPAAGAGLEFRTGHVRLLPEVRVTRWIDRNFGVRDAGVRSRLSQVEVLVGVGF